MSVYTLLNRAKATATLPPSPVVRPIPVAEMNLSQVVNGNILDPQTRITPPSQQCFQLVVTGTGAVSASAQLYGSNDGTNWATIGAPITATGTGTGTVAANGTVNFAFFGALLTAISGTGAVATLTMSC